MKKAAKPVPKVELGAPESIKLYLDERANEDYMPADILFQVCRKTGVAQLTWNRPDTLNAIQHVIIQETLFALEHVKQCEDIKVLVFTGAGRAFSAGASLKPRPGKKVKFPQYVIKAYRAKGMWWDNLRDIALKTPTLAFWNCPKICIGAINGLAVGGAANMALANYHDFVICSDQAKFKYPFSTLGITPELGSSYMLPYLIGMTRAKNYLMSGEWFSAQDSLEIGLANKVVPHENLLESALHMAATYATVPNQTALRKSKELINRHLRKNMADILDQENVEIKACLSGGNNALKNSIGGANTDAKL